MKRSNSLGNCVSGNKLIQIKVCTVKSMPNMQILGGEPSRSSEACGSGGLKRQSSKKVKILQKTWDKVMTIIHPSGRRNSRTKQSPSGELGSESYLASPSFTRVFKSNQSTPPSTPSKRLIFDFEPIVSPKEDVSVSERKAGRKQETETTSRHEPGTSERRTPRDDHAYYQCPEPYDPEVDQVVKNYVELQKRLSDELHHVMKGEKRKEEVLSAEFKKRLQQWEMWKASTGKFHYTEEELQKLIPIEFSKKLQEWEYMKSKPRQISESAHPPGCGGNISGEALSSSASSTAPIKNEQRRKKKKTDDSHRQKELAWLEKQLEKIEIEKKRLEREMLKYCEREERLQKMREALKNNPPPKQEVWIKTPTAECKVEGLNEKFTKKLYKWEEKRGIQPECSTMAFLNPKYFASSPEPEQVPTPDTEPPLSVEEPEPIEEPREERLSKDYSSQSEVSEVEYDEYDATDSFATKDEPASGASNTDSDCFNLKPGFRRRSSDAISTPLSSARSPSPSCCTSDDEENFMLQTVAENEEAERIEEKPLPVVVKAKSIVVEEEDNGGDGAGVIVKTQRTIFKPVEDADDAILQFGSATTNLSSPKLVKSLCAQISRSPDVASSQFSRSPDFAAAQLSRSPEFATTQNSCSSDSVTQNSPSKDVAIPQISRPLDGATAQVSLATGATTPGTPRLLDIGFGNGDFKKLGSIPQKHSDPPRIIGAVRKTSGASSIGPPPPTFRLPPIPALDKLPKIKDGSKPILGKIPVWCSPLMARRRFLDSQNSPNQSNADSKFSSGGNFESEIFRPQPNQDFSLDKFLETNAIPIPPPRPSRIPVTASPGCSRKKYSFSSNGSGLLRDESGISLLSLTRSNSFQNPGISRVPRGDLQLPVGNGEEEENGKVKGQNYPTSDMDPFLLTSPASQQVTKSKSTGSILGGGSGSRGFFGMASSFLHKSSETKAKKKK